MTESKENLKKRIDTNKNQYIENNEVDNFAKDKKNGDIDLNNLGEYLNNLPLYNNDELKKALNNFFRSPERNKYDQTIKNKVTNNQPLDKTELSLMYLAMISEPNKHFTQQQLKFDSSKPVDQICDGALIGFIRTKYIFPTYTGKKVKIDLPNKTKKKTNNPIDKIQESKGGNIKLPENIGEIKESEADFYCNRLITRAEKNFANDIEKAKREIEQNHRYKDEEEKKAYIKRDTLLIAFSKYTEAINSQHEKHITNSGYKDKTDFENQMKLIEEFGKEIERKYPNINNILEKIKKFDEEMKANEKKYFKNENETKKAEKNYKEFNDYMDKKSNEYNIDKIQESLKKEPKTKEEMEKYLQTMNKIFEFQEDLNKKNKTYGGSISKYQNYIKGAIDIQKKYNIQQYQEILEKYNQDISNWNKKIDFKKYENYKNGLDWKLEVGLKNINTLQGIITDPNKNKNILVKEFKDVEDKQQIKQNGIDRIRERIKKFSPGAYWTLTTFTGLWNGLIDATLGVSTSLGVMILGIIGGTDETLSQMDRKARRDKFFKIDQSSSQKEDVYNSETKEFNFHADNTVSTVASSISQMLTLIYGGGAIGSGASKVLGISENIAGRVGLFTSSFITQVGGSYQEAITHGLTGKNAIGYSFLSATIQSSLELVSPNDVLLGKGNGITKELIKNACNEGGKQSFMLIGKTFLKNVGLEIIEENIQEGLQTAAGNLINMVVNGTYGSKLGADWSWKNFASTAIITTLTTGITTGVSTGVQMYEMSNQDQTKLIEHIKSDNGLYLEVTGMLDKAIEGKISIPNISIEQLQNLKLSLTGNSNINTPSTNTNIQTDYEIKTSPEIEQISQILGSRFHEERKQSRLQSDGTYAPRVEKTSDQTWISQHNGQTEVDIANTPFEDLPSDWKSENLEAAKVAVGLIYDMVKNGEKVTSEMIEKMAEIVHNKRLERNGTEGSFENQRVPYEQLSEVEKEKDRNQLLRAIETVKQGNTDYFDGKPHKIFEGNTGKAESNSNLSDRILSEINEENKSEKLEELRKEITEQYKQATGEDLKLSDEQLLSILDAHEQDGELGKLKLGELKVKVKKLSEAIGDENIRRFLLEAGFCGKQSEIINDNKTNVEHLEELGIKIGALFSKKINNLNLDFEKLGKIKDLGVEIDQYNIDELNRIEGLDFEKLGKIKDLGVEIHANNIEKLNSMEGLDFEKLGKIKDLGVKLREPGRRLKGNLKNLNDIEIDFTTLWKLKELGIKIDELNIEKFNYLGLTNEDIQFIKENKLTEYNEIVFALILKDNTSKKTKQEYIKRKQEYLERNRTISEEKFMELFGLKGKYGKTEINQDRVGLCYAYTGFEILKKSNCFNELVQTNLREISDGKGWEVRLPMGDPDGKRIKVYGDEIDSKFERKYSNGDIETANINSESEYLGFKILEISFMKKYILETKENTKKIDYGIIKKAKLEYEKTGKITFNQELIEYIEGGEYYTFADILMMRGNCISLIKNEIDRVYGVNDNDKELAFKYFNTGTININIGINKENIKNNDYNKNLLNQDCEIINIDGRNGIIVHNVKIIDKAGYNFESTYRITEDGIIDKRFDEKGNYIGNKKMKEDLITNKEGKMIIQFFPNHAYSIEKCYTDDNTGEKRVWVINPRHTGLKFDISLEQAKSIFRWNVTGFDIDEMFREEENIEQTIDNQKENNDYFDGKSHQFEVTEGQARSNSENMDNLVNEINEENQKEKLKELRNEIREQYKQTTGEELQLSDEQLLSIIDAHEQDGILGELTLGQLRKKVKILDETIKDEKIRRFLLEFGFCGSRFRGILGTKNKIPQYQLNNSNNEKKLRYYQINEGVRIPRSNGSSTRAKITSYNQGIYTVEWSENGHIKAKELTQQEIDQENQLKMNPEEITRFNKNLPLVYRKGGLYPRHKINFGDGTTLYTTDKIVGKNSGRQYIIGYTFDNYGTMHLRQFYRSMSEGCWRACPGMREDGNLSKGEFITDSSYETTTKVDLSLGNTFDNLQQTYYNDFGPYNNYFSYSPISYIASSYKKNYILSDDMGPQNIYIRKLFPNLVGNDKTGHNKYNATDFYAGKYGHTIESVTKGYNNLVPEGLDYKHMKLNPNKSYSYHHEYLGNVNVQVCTIKRKGIDLDFHFARAINSPDKVWIENVACSDAQLNSWGVYNKQINAGPLVAKPVDYKEQCPNGGNIDQILPKVSPDYRDIRNLYQGNPIIKRFKQISK